LFRGTHAPSLPAPSLLHALVISGGISACIQESYLTNAWYVGVVSSAVMREHDTGDRNLIVRRGFECRGRPMTQTSAHVCLWPSTPMGLFFPVREGLLYHRCTASLRLYEPIAQTFTLQFLFSSVRYASLFGLTIMWTCITDIPFCSLRLSHHKLETVRKAGCEVGQSYGAVSGWLCETFSYIIMMKLQQHSWHQT
jgi:hypothetical protein